MAGKIVTLDIDSATIKLMETRGRRVVKWASLSLEPTTAEEGEEEVSSSQTLGTAIKNLMASSGIEGRDVIASVSGLYSLSHLLPGRLTTREAIETAAAEIMPLPPEEFYLSWKTIAVGEDETEVLVVGVPREVIDTEIRALRSVGISPRVLELRAMALTRVVNKERALILNIEPADLDIIMVVDGMPEIMRTIAWQPDDLSLEDRVEYLAATLELTVAYYDSNHPGTPLDPTTPFFITGEMSGDPALVEKLLARIGYPVELLAPPLEYPAHLPVSQYAVNIGLTLKGMAPDKTPEPGGYLPPDINLLPEAYKPWKPSSRQIYFALLLIVFIGLLFPMYQVTGEAMGKTANLQAKYDVLNSQLQRRKDEIENRVPLQNAVNDYRAILNLGGYFTEDLEVIKTEARKLGVKLSPAISHQGDSISFSYEADDYLTFKAYAKALEETGRFVTPIELPEETYPPVARASLMLVPKTGE